MLYKTDRWKELRKWSHKITLVDTSTTSSNYFEKKRIATTNKNSNFDIRVKRVNSWYNKPFFNVSRKAVTWSSPTPTCSLGPWMTWHKRRCKTSMPTSVKPPSCTLPTSQEKIQRIEHFKMHLNTISKELTTKSIFSAKGPQSFSVHIPSCSLHSSCDFVVWIFPSCCVVHAMRFLSVIFSKPSSTPYSSFSTDILQCDGCLFVLFLWGLMAGLCSCTSHGGTIQSRGWLPKVETPGYSRHPTAINPLSPNIHMQILQTGLHTFP